MGDQEANTAERFGARDPPIMDSGAGNHVCDEDDVPNHDIRKTSHTGFKNASGGCIPARGEADVHFINNQIEKGGTSRFILGPVKRPLFSTGRICDKNNIALFSSRGAFVVDEATAMPLVQQLLPSAKLSFKRDASTNGLYVLDGRLQAPFPRQAKR